MDIRKCLFELADDCYADFQAKLTPTIERELFIGVRVPKCRMLAKELYKTNGHEAFLADLPHCYYDENILHSLILSEFTDFDLCIKYIDSFLPFVDNWAVCDTMSPKCFKKNKERLLKNILEWIKSKETYTCRFGIGMLMRHFLDESFKKEYLNIVAEVKSNDYYVKMMVAWFFATALAKKWDDTIPYLKNNILDTWIHNKTIQKAIESNRISIDQKTYLKTIKRA